jgi:hypothetical protein
MCLCGCWAPPAATLRPDATPGVVADAIAIEKVVRAATVESVGCDTRTVTLSARGLPLGTYQIGPRVRNWGDLRIGDAVDVRIKNGLSVYVPSPGGDSPDSSIMNHPPEAHVLLAEPSYRLLTLQYADGATETFKVALHTRLSAVMPGSSVTIWPIQALKLHARGHLVKGAGVCSGATSSP